VKDVLNLVGAGRIDHHSDYPTQLSPKAAVVYSITPMHKLRAGYNRAFKSPTILENYLFINNTLLGNRTGFEIRDSSGGVVAEIDPLQPEEVSSVEVGYKGVVAERLLLDAVAYNSWYENFISPLTQVANPADMTAPTFAFYPDGTPVAQGTPAEGTLFTYSNFGKALVRGVDVGFDYLANPYLTLTSSVSYIDLVDFESGNSGQNELLLNVPDFKLKASVLVKNFGLADYFVRVGGRWENRYKFRSGYWDSERLLPDSGGEIPARFILDASAGYQFANGLSLSANVQNALDNGSVENLGAPVPHRFAYLQVGYRL
jgi:iron complex outermembrane receptor protein